MISRSKILSMLTTVVVFVSFVNFLASKALWYYLLLWFDMPMHFLGGVVLLLLLVYIFYDKIYLLPKLPVLKILIGVLFIGIGWEVFEYIFNNIIAGERFDIIDTLSDICFDMAGGISGLVLIKSRSNTTLTV